MLPLARDVVHGQVLGVDHVSFHSRQICYIPIRVVYLRYKAQEFINKVVFIIPQQRLFDPVSPKLVLHFCLTQLLPLFHRLCQRNAGLAAERIK